MRIFYPGARGGAFGWGVFGDQITRQFAAMGIGAQMISEADVCLMPLADHDFTPATNDRAAINCAVCFFEYELGPNAAANAAKYDIVFAGSTWCLDRMRERGITNGQLLIQGVDHSVFYPRPRTLHEGQFRVFSGGKFEYRKGQDLVIAAFREFLKCEPTAHLVCSWFNLWPSLITGSIQPMMEASGMRVPAAGDTTQAQFFHDLLVCNGVPAENFTVLPQMRPHELATVMAQTDCGLFPNRCEGGTNLVLMEYAAMGLEVIANLQTGHADVSELISMEIESSTDGAGWAVQEVDEITVSLMAAKTAPNWQDANPQRPQYTWQQTAQTVANAVASLTAAV